MMGACWVHQKEHLNGLIICLPEELAYTHNIYKNNSNNNNSNNNYMQWIKEWMNFVEWA